VDQLTGTYNFDGLSKRVREIVAESRRYERPMSCLVLGEPLEGRGLRPAPGETTWTGGW
jgi:hypothetical protein